MANDIDRTSPHYKGDFGSIYEVNKKYPTGGVAGDFVVIDGWAHYWNADRGTWCVNAERDSYWDELITNIIEKFKLVRGATYMGVASLDTVPAKVIGAKMYYFATVAGTYKNFGDLAVPQGINVLYSENGSIWVCSTLLEVAQELGVSTNKVVSQKALNDALNLKANQSSVNEALAKKADNKRVDDELAKKFDKASVVQEFGDSEDKVVSQFALPFREIESPEFIKAIVDAEDHFLFGIQLDGSIEWGKGIPAPIRAKLQEIINQCQQDKTDIFESISAAKEELSASIAALQEGKVDKEEGKSLIEDEVKECFKVIENKEFIKALVDSEDRVLFGFRRDTGKPYCPLNEMYHITQNKEFLWVILDAVNHPLLGIKQDGTSWAAKAQWLDDIEAIKSDIIKLFAENKVDLGKKKISILGDSLSTFEGYIPPQNTSYYPNASNDVNSVKQTWWDILLNTINATLEINNSFSGSKVSGTDASSFITRHSELGNPEYIIIHGGTNDASWANVPAGELHFDSPLNDLNINEFSDAYDFLIRCIVDKYKHTNIILVIPSIVSNEYANSIISICEHYQLFGYVDLRNVELTLSSGHYQKDSMQVVAEKVLEVISKNKNVERVFGKSLIDEEYASSVSSIDNNEYLAVEQDAEGKVLSSTNPDGSHYIHNAKSETIPEEFTHIEDLEGRTEITIDAEDKILGYRDSEGTRHEHKISANHIELSDEAATEVSEAFKSAGIKMDNPSDFSKNSHIELPIPRIAAQVRLYAPKLPTTKQDNIEAEIEYNDKDGNYFRKPVVLNAQGSSSMGYYVKNMAIDIADESEIKFGDFPTQDSFHLKKYYIDAFRGQCIVAYWLMEQVYQTRPIGQQYPYEYTIANDSVSEGLGSPKKDFFTGAKCHPDGFPINITWVSNDGKETDMGIYTWNLKKSKEVYYADKKNAKNIILDGSIWNPTLFGGNIDWTQFEVRNPKSLKDIDGNKYDGDNPKELSDTDKFSKSVKDSIVRLSTVAAKLRENNSKETFESFFLVNPFIDYYIVAQVLYHYDGFIKNWIWCTWDGLHWTPTLYDTDSIFGSHATGIFVLPNSDNNTILGEERCLGLETLYSEEIAARYKELRNNGIFSTDNIIGLLKKWLESVGYDNLKKEFTLFPQTPSYRKGYFNENWAILDYGYQTDDYNNEKEYQKGETCIYARYKFKALNAVQNVAPISQFYDKAPTAGGYYNSVIRVYNWLKNRLAFLDKNYGLI